jgi:segregation and condensation protein A
MSASLSITIHAGDNSYDGPLDVLLGMIRYHGYPMDSLPVARLTNGFLAYVRRAEELEQDLAGEFVEVASWLVLLKSRAMLPADAQLGHLPPEEELRRVLAPREIVEQTAVDLKSRTPRRPPTMPATEPGVTAVEEEPSGTDMTVAGLLKEAESAMALAHARRYQAAIDSQVMPVSEALLWVKSRVEPLEDGTVIACHEWFESFPEAGNKASLFLALLELAKAGYLLLYQRPAENRIYAKRLTLAA